MTYPELKSLLAGCSSGSEPSWREFIKLFHPLVRAAVSRVCSDQCDDAVQLVYERLIESNYRLLRRFDGPFAAFLIYVQKVAKNVAFAHMRSSASKTRSVDSKDQAIENLADSAAQPEQLVLTDELFSALEDAIMNLEPGYREVVSHLYHGFTHREVAELMHVPLNTILTHASRAKEILRRELKVEIK